MNEERGFSIWTLQLWNDMFFVFTALVINLGRVIIYVR